MQLTDQILQQALQLLGELLASRKAADYHLVVCGGSALVAQEVVSRTTHDVDVLAQQNWDQEVSSAYPLPEDLAAAAAEVARELDLKPNWLNSSASFHFPDLHALPTSFWTDLKTHDYGDHLRVRFVGRSGQILLKLYATLNREEDRDLEDLHALGPDADETDRGLKWLLSAIPTITHRERLGLVLARLGHEQLLQKYQG